MGGIKRFTQINNSKHVNKIRDTKYNCNNKHNVNKNVNNNNNNNHKQSKIPKIKDDININTTNNQ
jgi:hypothetical protein